MSASWRRLVVLVAAVSTSCQQQARALSSSAGKVTLLGVKEEYVPASFASKWPTWVLSTDGQMSRIPSDEGFVNPVSFEEMWLAEDLKPPVTRLALGVHVRKGAVRHLMPAVDARLDVGDKSYRNRGMCTVPRASTWLAPDDRLQRLRLVAFLDDRRLICDFPVSELIERAIEALATTENPDLATGSHILHVLINDEKADLPPPAPGKRLRLGLADFTPEAPEELGVDSALLDVLYTEAAAGGESDFLPDAYRQLYEAPECKP